MSIKLERLCQELKDAFGERITEPQLALGEVTVECSGVDYFAIAKALRDRPEFAFEQLIDLSGIDYSTYSGWAGRRFAVVCHLTSLQHNRRLRLRAFAADDQMPLLASVTEIWNGANWYEREAFDLYGILFEGHSDLRRILTDYGFIGHPFRKDFPVSGHVEMRYDPELHRVVYQPVSIPPREVTPRIVREETYGRG
jgi:NADH-quinone oxidoreductase subunit C